MWIFTDETLLKTFTIPEDTEILLPVFFFVNLSDEFESCKRRPPPPISTGFLPRVKFPQKLPERSTSR